MYALIVPLLLLAPPGPDAAPDVDDAVRSDARLADVCFVDVEYGWAVGDRGTIWHTADSGRHWQIQSSGVVCPLESVCFLDRQTGWAAGAVGHPYLHTGAGILLATSDGGSHWQSAASHPLPPLKKIRFLDGRRGWAIGSPTAMYPSGVLTTDSGGRNWTPLPGATLGQWLTGDCLGPTMGVLAGRRGMAATLQRNSIEPARNSPFGIRNLTRLRLVAPPHGWLIGDGGLVLLTGDLSATWQPPAGELPAGMAQQFDFQALAVRGPKCWIAGTPGTRIFHTPDAGRNWLAFTTGVSTPLDGLWFVDDHRGWAVGALGTILATLDGGRTWQRQRAGGARAALLALVARPEDIPLELFARLSGNEGFLGVAEVLTRQDVELAADTQLHPADRMREAVTAVGASDARVAWRFPLRQAGLELDVR